jgi:hypothetical protein
MNRYRYNLPLYIFKAALGPAAKILLLVIQAYALFMIYISSK